MLKEFKQELYRLNLCSREHIEYVLGQAVEALERIEEERKDELRKAGDYYTSCVMKDLTKMPGWSSNWAKDCFKKKGGFNKVSSVSLYQRLGDARLFDVRYRGSYGLSETLDTVHIATAEMIDAMHFCLNDDRVEIVFNRFPFFGFEDEALIQVMQEIFDGALRKVEVKDLEHVTVTIDHRF